MSFLIAFIGYFKLYQNISDVAPFSYGHCEGAVKTAWPFPERAAPQVSRHKPGGPWPLGSLARPVPQTGENRLAYDFPTNHLTRPRVEPKDAPPRRGLADRGFRPRPKRSLTLLIWKEKRRRRCPGDGANHIIKKTLTGLRSLEDNTIPVWLWVRTLGLDGMGPRQKICRLRR